MTNGAPGDARPEDVRVAIVTVCRNAAASLGRCLDSVAAQGATNLVHVVQDGASTDGSAALLAAHAARVDLRLVSEPDGGQNDAVVRALRRCPAVDMVGFVWADEMLLPGAVARACTTFAAAPELAAVYGDVLEVDLAGRPLGVRTAKEWSCDAVARYEDIPPVNGAFVRAAVVATLLRIAPRAPECTEWLLWLAAGATGPVRRMPGVQSAYAIHPGQLSRQPAIVDAYAGHVARAAYALAADRAMPAALRAAPAVAAANAHLQAGEWLALTTGDAAAALRHLDAALGHTPESSLMPLHVWQWSVRWIAAGRSDLVFAVLDRAQAAGVRVPVAGLLVAGARLVEGDAGGAEAAVLALDDEPGAADALPQVAGFVRYLQEAGRCAQGEHILAYLRQLVERAPNWRVPFAMGLANLERFEEAHAALAGLADRVADGFRLQLELLMSARDPEVRRVLGRAAGRDAPLDLAEADALAVAASHALSGQAALLASLVTVLAVVADHARRRGFTTLVEAVGRLGLPAGRDLFEGCT